MEWAVVKQGSKTVFLLSIWCIFVLTLLFLASNIPIPTTRNGVHVSSNLSWKELSEPRGSGVQSIPTTENLLDLEPNVDKSPRHPEDMILDEIQRRIPSLPIAYWKQHKHKPMFFKNKSCAKFPSIYELEFNNLYWQSLRTSNGTFQLFGAYYDMRNLSKIGPTVRILGMLDRINPTVKTYCQFWMENHNEPVFVRVSEYNYMWNRLWGYQKQGILQPYLITCQIPSTYHKLIPVSVSLVERPCDTATNILRVIFNKSEKKKGFAVCVKGLDFLHEDLSVRLVEWIELLGILGAEKVFLYELQVHPNITKVLSYFEERGKVEVTPLTLPGGQPNLPEFQHMYLVRKVGRKRLNEIIPYNDCLYKHLYTYEYIAMLDVDEVIIPMKTMSWREMMDDVVSKALAVTKRTIHSYNVRHLYFLDDVNRIHDRFEDIPKYMLMLQHVYRGRNFSKPGYYVKSFHNPERVLTVHNHLPLACLGSRCESHPIDTADAQLHHYRAGCDPSLKSCSYYRKHSVVDTTIWKFKDKLIARTMETLKKLGFL